MLSSSLLLGVVVGLQVVNSFYFEVVDPGSVRVAPGGRVTLRVQTDGHYEWCKFFRPGGEFCDFEWKRNQGNITMQDCQLKDKVKFHGNYDDKQCGITFLAGEGDSGVWSVEVEEYYWGSSRGAGKTLTANFTVQVAAPTPMPSEPTATSAGTTTTMKKTTPSTIAITTGTTTTPSTQSTVTTESTTPSTVPSTPTLVTEKNAEQAVKKLDEAGDDSTPPEAVPRVDKAEKAGGSSSGIVAGIVVFLLVVIVAASGVLYYRRRKNSNTASVLYDNEGQEGMVGDTGPAVTIAGRETSNLHEYYPPSLPYSNTGTPGSDS